MKNIYRFRSKVWIYPGMAAWHFVSVPPKESHVIQTFFLGMERGFGSFPVLVTVGKSTWNTSIFPDKKSGTYHLPLKAPVRKNEGIHAGDTVSVSIKVLA